MKTVYLKHDDIEFSIDGSQIDSTGGINVKFKVGYGKGRELSGTILDQTLTREELGKLLRGLEKIYYYSK